MASKAKPPLTLRLYLVRHGETLSNTKHFVAGQAESPLTRLGEKQALALGGSGRVDADIFWKVYASDLQRTQDTTRLILQGTRDTQADAKIIARDEFREKVQLDKRLRELLKGPRQGYHKTLTNAEATALRRKESEADGEEFKEEDIPALESELDGYTRFSNWLFDICREAILEYKNAATTNQEPPYLTLVVSHSAMLRSTLTNLFSKETLEANGAAFDPPNHLIVPNTSLTIVDIVPDVEHECWQNPYPPGLPKRNDQIWTAKLVELHWTGHYKSIAKDTSNGNANVEL